MSVSQNAVYRFAFSKIAVIVLISLLCAGLVISVANDMFAFVKPSRSLTVELYPSVSLEEFSEILQEEGIIENSFAFFIYARLKKADIWLPSFSGTVELNSDMGYRDILNQFK